MMMKLLNPRMRIALKMREEKKTYREIGEALCCGPNRARMIYQSAEFRIKEYRQRQKEGTETLSTRALNGLVNWGCRGATKEQIKEKIETGVFRMRKNLGEKTFLEICEWAEATAPGPGHKMKKCPYF